MFSIGIIGGGVAGVSLCMQLKEALTQVSLKAEILIFEKKNKIGVGIPYDNDEQCYRINIKKHLMEPMPGLTGQFSNWLHSTDFPIKKNLFPPRHYFGHYLQMSAMKMQEEAIHQGIKISFLMEHDVFNFKAIKNNQYEIFSNNRDGKTVHHVNFIVLCLGHLPTSNYKNFTGQQGYYHDPWDEKLYDSVNMEEKICIIGSKLTAIDVALKLQKIKHRGLIYMASPSGLLPTIKANESDYQLKHLIPANIRHLLTQHSTIPIRLNQLLKLFTEELSACLGYPFNIHTFMRVLKKISAIDRMKYESNQLKMNNVQWQKIMSASYQCILHLWPLLSLEDRSLFQKKYSSVFMTFLCSVPLESATKIHNLLIEEKLQVLGGLQYIGYENSHYCLNFKNGVRRDFQQMINATGAGNDFIQVELLDNLLRQGVLVPHELGGIKVNNNTLQIINRVGQTNRNLYAVGDLIKGECFSIIEIGRIVEQGKVVARNVVNCI